MTPFPSPENCMRIAILNDNPSLAADLVLNSGSASGDNLNVVDTGLSGAGWGQPVNYNDIQPGTVNYLPNASGVFKTLKLVLNAYTFTAGQQVIIKVMQQGSNESQQPYSQTYDYFVPASPTTAGVVTALAALITNQSNGLVTAVNNTNDLDITGNFGDLTLEVFDFTVSINISGITQSVVTALVNPVGTPAQLAFYFGATSALITAAGYNCYFAECRQYVRGDQAFVETDVLPKFVLVWVNAAGDSGVGSFNAEWTDVFAGTKAQALYVGR